MNNIPIDMMC